MYSDIIERFSFYWTSLILATFVLLIKTCEIFFLESAIKCITQSDFTATKVKYTHDICWHKTDDIFTYPSSNPAMSIRMHPYHAKIPLILLVMLLGFQIPNILNLIAGIFLGSRSKFSRRDFNMNADTQKYKVDRLAEIVEEHLDYSSRKRSLTQLICKLLICLNILIQFIFITVFFKDTTKYRSFKEYDETSGTEKTHTIVEVTPIFPQVIVCQFPLSEFLLTKNHSVQCSVNMNNLYEQFFYIFSYWLIVIGVISVVSLFSQFGTLCVPRMVRIRFRGIIPQNVLENCQFSLDDTLLYLLDIERTQGAIIAREVAGRLSTFQRTASPKDKIDSYIIPMVAITEADTSTSALVENQEKPQAV